MSTTRTFVAIELPDSPSEKIARLQSQLAKEVSGVRWTAVRPFHITLVFLGDVNDTDLNDVCRAVQSAACSYASLELRAEALGAFGGPKRPRTLWVGIAGPDRALLEQLQAEVAGALAETGYSSDNSPFQPHITIGRVVRDRRRPVDVTDLLDRHKTWSAGSFRAAEVVTFSSTLTPDGPVYAAIARAPLTGRNRSSKT